MWYFMSQYFKIIAKIWLNKMLAVQSYNMQSIRYVLIIYTHILIYIEVIISMYILYTKV